MKPYEFECALSGITSPPGPYDEEHSEDMPFGWIKVTIERRMVNPEYLLLQQAKAAMTEGLLQQVPPESRDEARPIIKAQVDATFYAKEQATEMSMYLTETAYLADPAKHTELLDDINEVREALGMNVEDENDEEEEEQAAS